MKKQLLGAAGLLTIGLVAGSAFAITGANAADNTTTSTVATATTDSSTATTDATAPADRPDVFSSTSIKPGESNVTGETKTKLEAAALAEVPGATVIRAENDSDGDVYEVHLKKADGSVVTVTFDADFKVTGTHEGFADASKGGPAGGHGPAGDNDGDGPTFQAPTTTGSTTQSN